MFYHELKEELAPIKPLGKFMVVKVKRTKLFCFSWKISYLPATQPRIYRRLSFSSRGGSRSL
jgi:hypothetical protein